MIAIYHLYWIIPLCFLGGFFFGSYYKKDGEKDET